MIRESDRLPRRWRSTEIVQRDESSDTDKSTGSDSFEVSPRIKSTSTPLRTKYHDVEDEIDNSPRDFHHREKIKEASDEESSEAKFSKKEEHSTSEKSRHSITEKRKLRRERRGRRRGRRELADEKREKAIESMSSGRRHSGSDAINDLKKDRSLRGEELPITEILKRAQDNTRTKYEKPAPLSELTTTKIYIQGRNGFSAMKIGRARSDCEELNSGRKRHTEVIENENCPPIKVAIVAQTFWKNVGLIFQGILAGLALMHLLMLHVFFNASVEFLESYSMISEIYTNIFSFLVVLCVLAIFDKFDLARFGMEHFREIYADYSRTLMAIPLYLIIFSLHQVSSKTDDQLALMRYYNSNLTLWDNTTNLETFLEDLNSWQRISISKDLLAVFAWLFVSLGTRDDAFLIHLKSMEKYANDVESTRE